MIWMALSLFLSLRALTYYRLRAMWLLWVKCSNQTPSVESKSTISAPEQVVGHSVYNCKYRFFANFFKYNSFSSLYFLNWKYNHVHLSHIHWLNSHHCQMLCLLCPQLHRHRWASILFCFKENQLCCTFLRDAIKDTLLRDIKRRKKPSTQWE